MNTWNAVVKALEAEKTEFIFGLLGGDAFYDALYDAPQIKPVLVREESSGPFMAMANAWNIRLIFEGHWKGPWMPIQPENPLWWSLLLTGGILRPGSNDFMKNWINNRMVLSNSEGRVTL